MAGEVVQKESSGKGKGLRRKKRRLGIRIDMTPMVDIAFLLLIFYMVTTVFAMPQAMEINLPPKSDETEERGKVKQSNLLNIRVDKYGDVYYDIGNNLETGAEKMDPKEIPMDSVRNMFIRYNWDRPKLNTLIIIHPEAKYSAMVDLLDEIEVSEALLRANEDFMRTYKEANPDEERFSFRYSIDHWGPKDDKKMERVSGQIGGGS